MEGQCGPKTVSGALTWLPSCGRDIAILFIWNCVHRLSKVAFWAVSPYTLASRWWIGFGGWACLAPTEVH